MQGKFKLHYGMSIEHHKLSTITATDGEAKLCDAAVSLPNAFITVIFDNKVLERLALFIKKSKQFNQSNTASDFASLTLMLSENGPYLWDEIPRWAMSQEVHIRGGSRIPCRRGHQPFIRVQHTILPKFQQKKKLREINNFGRRGRAGDALDPPIQMLVIQKCGTLATNLEKL